MSEKLYLNHDENIEFGIISNGFAINVTDHCGDKSAWLCLDHDQLDHFLQRLNVYKKAIEVYKKTGEMPDVERGTRPRPEPDPRIAIIAKKRASLEKARKIVKEEESYGAFLFPAKFDVSKFRQQKEARKAWDLGVGLLPVKDFETKVLACADIVSSNKFSKLDEITGNINFGARIHPEAIELLERPEVTNKQLWVWYAYLYRFFSQDLSNMTDVESKKVRQLSEKYFGVEEYTSEERLATLEELLLVSSGESSKIIMHAAKILDYKVPDDISFDFIQNRSFFIKDEVEQMLLGKTVGPLGPDFFSGDWQDILIANSKLQ